MILKMGRMARVGIVPGSATEPSLKVRCTTVRDLTMPVPYRPLSRTGSLELLPDADMASTSVSQHSDPIALGVDAMLLRGWAAPAATLWMAKVRQITDQAPFRTMQRPGGAAMWIGMTNCGAWSWVSDARRYHYSDVDPVSGAPSPAMLLWLANQASAAAAQQTIPTLCRTPAW